MKIPGGTKNQLPQSRRVYEHGIYHQLNKVLEYMIDKEGSIYNAPLPHCRSLVFVCGYKRDTAYGHPIEYWSEGGKWGKDNSYPKESILEILIANNTIRRDRVYSIQP